jgi:outer membrane murein-binding lipoprotein Lpp
VRHLALPFLLPAILGAALLAAGCSDTAEMREVSVELRCLTLNQRYQFEQYLTQEVSRRREVVKAKVFLRTEEEQGDYIIVRVIPNRELWNFEVEKEIRLWLYHKTRVPPPLIHVVLVYEL